MSDLTLKVLIVEDNPADARLIETMLGKVTSASFCLARCSSLATAIAKMTQEPFQVALLDLGLPDSQGLETLREMRAVAADLPIVVLTGLDDERAGVNSLREGAQDYLLKDELRPNLLSRAIFYAIERQQILDRLQQSQAALQAQEAFFRSIVDTNPNFIFVKDAQGRYILANRALAEFYQTTPGQILGKTEADLNPNLAQSRQHEREERDVLTTLAVKTVDQEPIRSSDGEVRWLKTIRKPLLSADGRADCLLGVSIDITERQRAEERLWQQAEREQLLAKVTQQIRRSLDLPEILTTAAARVRQVLAVDRVLVYRCVYDQDRALTRLHLEACDATPTYGCEDVGLYEPPMSLLAEPITSPNYHIGDFGDLRDVDLPPSLGEFFARLSVQSLLAVPILRGDAIESITKSALLVDRDGPAATPSDPLWGLLFAQHCGMPRRWEPWEIEFLQQLVAQLSVGIQQAELYRRLELANQALERLAALDGLTGIPNRRSFDRVLEREWHRLARTGQSLALIVGDIDSFKAYNDFYGHLAGDDCLRQVAQAIATSLRRSTDLAFRYGGEEFAAILPHTDIPGAVAVAESIVEAVRALQLPHGASVVNPFVTISLGVASIIPHPDLDPASLIAAADGALFAAKAMGRNRVEAAPSEDPAVVP